MSTRFFDISSFTWRTNCHEFSCDEIRRGQFLVSNVLKEKKTQEQVPAPIIVLIWDKG